MMRTQNTCPEDIHPSQRVQLHLEEGNIWSANKKKQNKTKNPPKTKTNNQKNPSPPSTTTNNNNNEQDKGQAVYSFHSSLWFEIFFKNLWECPGIFSTQFLALMIWQYLTLIPLYQRLLVILSGVFCFLFFILLHFSHFSLSEACTIDTEISYLLQFCYIFHLLGSNNGYMRILYYHKPPMLLDFL